MHWLDSVRPYYLPTRSYLQPLDAMATTQFDKIYYGLSPEAGSKSAFIRCSSTWGTETVVHRIPRCGQRNGMERRRKREGDCTSRRRHKMGPVVSCSEELSTESRTKGQAERNIRWIHAGGREMHVLKGSTVYPILGPRQTGQLAQATFCCNIGGEGCHLQRMELGYHRYSRCSSSPY